MTTTAHPATDGRLWHRDPEHFTAETAAATHAARVAAYQADVPGYNSRGARLLRTVTAGRPPIPALENVPATVTTDPAADPALVADVDALVAAIRADHTGAVDTVRRLAPGNLTLTADPHRVLLSGRWFTVTDPAGTVLGRVVRFPVDPDTLTESYGALTGHYGADDLTGPAAALAFILEHTGGAS